MSDFLNDIINKMSDELNDKRVQSVHEKLAEKGYPADYAFKKERCVIIKEGDMYFLYVDFQKDTQDLICSWSNEVNTYMEGNSIRFTIG